MPAVSRLIRRAERRPRLQMLLVCLCWLSAHPHAAHAQGTVLVQVEADGRPVEGASVSTGAAAAITDRSGHASIAVPETAATITVEAAGFVPATLQLAAGARPARLEVELEAIPEFEEDVVVTARSPTRLQDLPLRVEVIDREEIEEKALMTPGSVAMLIGETTGLRVQPTAPSLGSANVRIQGLRGRYSQLLADGLPLYGGQGDSLSLLQVPPLDLGRVEIIKGVASALYGASALGGVINLVSRRPTGPARELLLNQTSLDGSDAAVWWAETPNDRWSWSVLGGAFRQHRRDRDDDGWTDVAGYRRGSVRPRAYYDSGAGTTIVATAGLLVEEREGGTIENRRAPDGGVFAESLGTRRGDAGIVARWLTASTHVLAVRASYGRQSQDRQFGTTRERGARDTLFGEVSLQSQTGAHTWVVGAAYQHDGHAAKELPRFDYSFHVPALFVQDEVGVGRLRVALSGRIDAHSEYGMLATPRASLLWKPVPAWAVRLSTGGGAFAPTPFIEDTDEIGLSRVDTPAGLRAERAWGTSLDVTRRIGGLELNGTLFGSTVRRPVRLASAPDDHWILVNVEAPIQTWGAEALTRYRRGAVVATATYAFTRSTESARDVLPLAGIGADRVEVALTPRHYAAFDLMLENERRGRIGLEAYYVGRQSLDENPYRDVAPGQVILGALVERRFNRIRLFANAENLGDRRQTRYDPLVRPVRHPDGRWTVDAWGPLDGRVVNGGIRMVF